MSKNANRIVRVRNEEVHKIVAYVASLTHCPYQAVFDEFCNYIAEGHVIGELSHHVLIERILVKNQSDEE